MASTIPLQQVPYQTLECVLNGQNTKIEIYQKFYGVFITIYLNNNIVIAGVLCENLHLIIRNTYLGYAGDFVFQDTQGTSDPIYTGLGTQYQLVYLTPDEIAAFDLPAGVG